MDIFTSEISYGVCDEVVAERVAQHHKWGQQNHPSTAKHYHESLTPDQLCEYYGILTEAAAKWQCQNPDKEVGDTWAAIAIEELSEAVSATPDKRREELVQLAAVVVAWIESIDRNGND